MDAKTEDFPPTDPPLPDEYSDVESEDDAATERTKYQRGGRKQSTTNHIRQSRMPPVPEADIATEPNHREEAQMDETERQLNGETQKVATPCPECAARKQTVEQKPVEEKPPTPFETGIRAFNLRRAAASGGRPVDVRATPSGDKKSKKKSSKKKKKKAKVEVKESESEEESSSEEEEEKPKPMSIKLDLDLVIEIFLKAKIQGEVTITFM